MEKKKNERANRKIYVDETFCWMRIILGLEPKKGNRSMDPNSEVRTRTPRGAVRRPWRMARCRKREKNNNRKTGNRVKNKSDSKKIILELLLFSLFFLPCGNCVISSPQAL